MAKIICGGGGDWMILILDDDVLGTLLDSWTEEEEVSSARDLE